MTRVSIIVHKTPRADENLSEESSCGKLSGRKMQKVNIVIENSLPDSLSCSKKGRFSLPKTSSSAVGISVLANATYAVANPIKLTRTVTLTTFSNLLPYAAFANYS